MTSRAIDQSQRTAAKVAGFSCLFGMAIVVFANYAIFERLIIPGNAAETARNIVAHERLFRIAMACNITYSVGVVVLLAALYVILKPVNPGLALVGALCRLVGAGGILVTQWVGAGVRTAKSVDWGRIIWSTLGGPDTPVVSSYAPRSNGFE